MPDPTRPNPISREVGGGFTDRAEQVDVLTGFVANLMAGSFANVRLAGERKGQ